MPEQRHKAIERESETSIAASVQPIVSSRHSYQINALCVSHIKQKVLPILFENRIEYTQLIQKSFKYKINGFQFGNNIPFVSVSLHLRMVLLLFSGCAALFSVL